MWAIITNPKTNNSLPTVVNQNSLAYPEFISFGYEVLQEGTKREMESAYNELLSEYASVLD